MNVTVTKAHISNYPNPIRFKKGDRLNLGALDTEFPGWIRTRTEDDNEGWAPVQYVDVDESDDSQGTALQDYTAFELNTHLGENLTVTAELNDWYWVMNEAGAEGWVPVNTVVTGTLHRLAAFTDTPNGGNPAGVWIGDAVPSVETMQAVAANVGYSETAFVAPVTGKDRTVRYYSPEAEVSFCGHATIATGVVLGEAEGDGVYRLSTAIGPVPIDVRSRGSVKEAALTSVEPESMPAPEGLVAEALSALGWQASELDDSIPPAKAYAGAWHLILAVKASDRLADLAYDFDRLKALMLREGLTTLQLVWRERPDRFHARNPFPVGGVVEDPATGAAAAALGGYLRDSGLLKTPATLAIRQGEAMGRPSRLKVEVPARGGIVVSGQAVTIDATGQQ